MTDITPALRLGIPIAVKPAARLEQTAPGADSDCMVSHLLRLRAVKCVTLPMLGLLAGCGGTVSAIDTARSAPETITEAQAIAYAHAVNLRAGDILGFTSSGNEIEAPKPGRLALEEIHCSGAVNPTRRIARVESTEFFAGRGSYSEIVKSAVEVWPTSTLVAINNNPHHGSRSRVCSERFLRALHRQINLERGGRMPIGPSTITSFPNPLFGAVNGFRRRVDETRLLRTGAIRAHLYRDRFGFTIGPAEIELEATGFGHPVPTSTAMRALHLLFSRAMSHATWSTG